MPDTTKPKILTIPADAIQALQAALQAHLTNTANARAALAICNSLDQQLVSAFDNFARALAPVVETPQPGPVDQVTAEAAQQSASAASAANQQQLANQSRVSPV